MASIRTTTCARLRNTTLLRRVCSSLRAAGLTGCRGVGAYKVRRPVRLPHAVIIRKRLLPMGMIAVKLIPRVADFHGATIVLVLAVEGAVIAVEAPDHRRYLPNRSTTGAFPDRKCAVSVPPSPSSESRVHLPWPCRRGRGTCTEWREILPIRRCRLRAFSSGAGVSSTRLRSSQSHARRRRASSYNPEETTLPTSQRAPRPGRRTTRSIAREEWSKSAWTNL